MTVGVARTTSLYGRNAASGHTELSRCQDSHAALPCSWLRSRQILLRQVVHDCAAVTLSPNASAAHSSDRSPTCCQCRSGLALTSPVLPGVAAAAVGCATAPGSDDCPDGTSRSSAP